jgi:anti-sigma regulatory factor (Ser/Thr protein kinase)
MDRRSQNTAMDADTEIPEERLPGKSADAVSAHGSIALPGCLVHSGLTVSSLEWICQVLRCEDGALQPERDAFEGFHATLRVQTFDDIDICMKIASTALALSPVAVIGLRELVVNAVEHGNLEISFDEKTELLASGDWQAEIERRLGTAGMRDRFATVELRLDGDSFAIEIVDQGKGFDWSTFLDPETAPAALLHGRGMSLAMEAGFSSVEYRGIGNEVIVQGICDPDAQA